LESYDSLQRLLGFDQPLPVSENWSAAADFLHLIAGHCLTNKPEIIVECGSGLTTLALSACCRLNDCGHVYSLEHDDSFAAATRDQLGNFALAGFATVLHAPLQNRTIAGGDYLWYGLDGLQVEDIGMLVIDGPPGYLQKQSRYPAMPLLHDRLVDGCAVFLDDAAREDEKAIVDSWRTMYPSSRHSYIPTERGCVILIINRPD